MLEKQIQKQITDYLEWKHYFWWRNNSGAMLSEYKGKTRFMRFGQSGSPDLFIVINGKIIGCEVKNEKGKQTDNQKEWQERFEKAGGIYLLTRSLDEIQNYLNMMCSL